MRQPKYTAVGYWWNLADHLELGSVELKVSCLSEVLFGILILFA